MSRDPAPLVPVALVLMLLGGLAWLTRHPDAPLLEDAADWPMVGPLAKWFREQYRPSLPPPPTSGPEADAEVERPAPWVPPSLPPAGGRETVWVLPGASLREAPSDSAPVVLVFPVTANAIKLERLGDWFRVHHAGAEGWVHLEGYDETGGPPYGEAPEPPRALMPRAADEDTLAMARGLFGERERSVRIGPYAAYTDVRDDDLIRHLDGLAAQIEALYEARYGCHPLGSPRASLVVYRSELTYRILERRSERIAGLHSAGHASRGLAVLFVADHGRSEVGATLVHELVHFLNRRALGPALPPWIDEGLADDLAMARLGPDGRLDPSRLNGERRQEGLTIRVDGGLATLQSVRDALREGRLPSVQTLLELDWERYVRSDQRQLHYGAGAFWVRYLLGGDDGRHAAGFRRFLAGIAAGEPASAETLRQHLGLDWVTLDVGFRAWLAAYPPLDVLQPEARPTQQGRTRGSSSRQAASPPA